MDIPCSPYTNREFEFLGIVRELECRLKQAAQGRNIESRSILPAFNPPPSYQRVLLPLPEWTALFTYDQVTEAYQSGEITRDEKKQLTRRLLGLDRPGVLKEPA